MSPGMTGPWQVLGPMRPPLSEMVKIDYLYGAKLVVWSDVKILIRTFSHVAGRRGPLASRRATYAPKPRRTPVAEQRASARVVERVSDHQSRASSRTP